MKLVRTLSMIIALAGASTAYAQAPAEKKAPAPAEKKAPAKPAKEELGPAEVKKVEAFFDEFHGAVVKNTAACPKMATAIGAVLDKHGAWLKKTAESGKELPQASKDRMQKRQGELMEGIMKCKDDKDVLAVMQRFGETMGGGKKKVEDKAEATPPPPAKK